MDEGKREPSKKYLKEKECGEQTKALKTTKAPNKTGDRPLLSQVSPEMSRGGQSRGANGESASRRVGASSHHVPTCIYSYYLHHVSSRQWSQVVLEYVL
jgi:hypothetical protein